MITFNVTNISDNLLCSHKKVDPPKNVALGQLLKCFRVLCPFVRRIAEENGGSNEAYSSIIPESE